MIVKPNSRIHILDQVPALDYYDTQTADLPRHIGPIVVWNAMMAQPQPFLKIAFRIRDAISSVFGVKAINGFSGKIAHDVKVGDYLDFFLVEYIDNDTLVLTERDRHLDVMICVSTDGPRVSITSSVQVHNWFGRLYMVPVGVAHRWIVRGMLCQLQATLSEE